MHTSGKNKLFKRFQLRSHCKFAPGACFYKCFQFVGEPMVWIARTPFEKDLKAIFWGKLTLAPKLENLENICVLILLLPSAGQPATPAFQPVSQLLDQSTTEPKAQIRHGTNQRPNAPRHQRHHFGTQIVVN